MKNRFKHIIIMLMIMSATSLLAQSDELETGAYTVTYDALATNQCTNKTAETFDAIELLEELTLTVNVESVSTDTIVIEGDAYAPDETGVFTFTTDTLTDEEQNVEFVDSLTVEVTSSTSFTGVYRVEYTYEGEEPCTNLFPYTAERTSDDSDTSTIETGTYMVTYDETATNQCGNNPAETFDADELLESMTENVEVESASDNVIVIEGDTYVPDENGVFTFTTDILTDEEQNIDFVNSYTVEGTSSTSFTGVYRVEYTPEGEETCTNLFPYTAESTSGIEESITLETGTYTLSYEAEASTACIDGSSETFDAIEVLGEIVFDLDVESVSDESIVIDGNTYTLNDDGTWQYVVELERIEEENLEFSGVFTVEITSATSYKGTEQFDYTYDGEQPCTDLYNYTAEKS